MGTRWIFPRRAWGRASIDCISATPEFIWARPSATSMETVTMLRVCMLGMLLGAILLWADLSPWLSFGGLWLIGLAAALPFVDSSLWQSPLAVSFLHNMDISGYVGAIVGAVTYLLLGRR